MWCATANTFLQKKKKSIAILLIILIVGRNFFARMATNGNQNGPRVLFCALRFVKKLFKQRKLDGNGAKMLW
jgi:hypothetical protein